MIKILKKSIDYIFYITIKSIINFLIIIDNNKDSVIFCILSKLLLCNYSYKTIRIKDFLFLSFYEIIIFIFVFVLFWESKERFLLIEKIEQ